MRQEQASVVTLPEPPLSSKIDALNWRTYRDQNIGIQFQYPSSWKHSSSSFFDSWDIPTSTVFLYPNLTPNSFLSISILEPQENDPLYTNPQYDPLQECGNIERPNYIKGGDTEYYSTKCRAFELVSFKGADKYAISLDPQSGLTASYDASLKSRGLRVLVIFVRISIFTPRVNNESGIWSSVPTNLQSRRENLRVFLDYILLKGQQYPNIGKTLLQAEQLVRTIEAY